MTHIKLCRHHPEMLGVRYKDGKCKACVRERVRAWYIANRDVAHQYNKMYREMNKEKARVYREATKETRRRQLKAWKEANKEVVYQKVRAWCKANPGAVLAMNRRRHLAKINRTPSCANLKKIRAFYMEASAKGMTVDHIVPLQGKLVSGLHVEWNLQMLTMRENSSKRNNFEVAQ